MNTFPVKLLLVFLLISTFQQTLKANQTKAGEPKRYLQPLFEKVDVQKDIEFGEIVNLEGKNEKLLLDV